MPVYETGGCRFESYWKRALLTGAPKYPGVAQSVARLVWDQEVAGSRPATRTEALVAEWNTHQTEDLGFVGSTPTESTEGRWQSGYAADF